VFINRYQVHVSLLFFCPLFLFFSFERCTMAPRRGFVPRRRARFSREEFNRLLPAVPGGRPEQRPVLSSVLQNLLRSGIAAPFLRNGSDEAMDDLVLRFLTDRGERFWVFNHENGYDHLHAEYVFPITTSRNCADISVGFLLLSSLFSGLHRLVFMFVVALRRSNINNNGNNSNSSSRRRRERRRRKRTMKTKA
jgi:hypothetical protein